MTDNRENGGRQQEAAETYAVSLFGSETVNSIFMRLILNPTIYMLEQNRGLDNHDL